MQDRNNKKRVSTYKQRQRQRRSMGSADAQFSSYPSYKVKKSNSFRKILTFMTIVFFIAIFAILLFSNNKDLVSDVCMCNNDKLSICTDHYGVLGQGEF